MGQDVPTDADRPREIIDELRRLRESCEPKHAGNPRYHGYSLAISGLHKVINDLEAGVHRADTA